MLGDHQRWAGRPSHLKAGVLQLIAGEPVAQWRAPLALWGVLVFGALAVVALVLRLLRERAPA